MRSRWVRHLCGLGAALACGESPAVTGAPPAPIEGVWRTQNGTEVTITSCDEGYCGYLSKIVVPPEYFARYGKLLEDLSVEQYFDFNNKDPALRNRRVLGLRIVTMRPGGNPSRYTGELYNAADGNTYEGSLEQLGADQLRVTGCVLVVFCSGEDWVRVPGRPPGE